MVLSEMFQGTDDMVRRIPRDCSILEWAENPYVEANEDYSLIREGFLNTELIVPISRNRRFCHDLHGLYAHWKYRTLFASEHFLAEQSQAITEISDAAIFTASANHWHFFVDGLANLSKTVLERCQTIYVDRHTSDDQIAFLGLCAEQLLGKRPNVEVLSEGNYALKNVIVPTNKPFGPKIKSLRSLLALIDPGARQAVTYDRIYVTRKGAKTRRLLNEDAMLSMLDNDFGFHAVENENLNLIEQMEFFNGASVIMGPHGAGLTNIVFANEPKLLIELFNSLQQPFYPALAQALNASYMGFDGQAAPNANVGNDSDNAPFSVDVERVRRGLYEVLGQ